VRWLRVLLTDIDEPPLSVGSVRILHLHSDQVFAPRLATDSRQHVVWSAGYETFGAAVVTAAPTAAQDAVQIDLRFAGQILDAETGTHHNHFRDYDPRIGRYMQSDPLGITAGPNTYAYVNSDPLSGIDPFGLFDLIRPGGQPKTFAEASALAKLESTLLQHGTLMQEKINRLCPSARAHLQPIFDRWRVYVDPHIGNAARRARSTFATTSFQNQQTQFNHGFFNPAPGDPGTFLIFVHEFRHLMPANRALFTSSHVGRQLSGHGGELPGEKDADDWASKFLHEECTCGQ
jgi:RHS repeat-associated protein